MNERMIRQVWVWAAGLLIAVASMAAAGWGLRIGWSVGLGGVWNLANLWCLSQLLQAWLGPQASRRRVIQWLLIKFPVLYLLVVGLLQHPDLSVVGFGVGFTVVLMGAVVSLALSSRHLVTPTSHER